MKLTKIALRKIIREELLKEASYYRLSKNVISNELYRLNKNFKSIYSTLVNGNDFNKKEFDTMINSLQKISKSARKFNVGDDIPNEFK